MKALLCGCLAAAMCCLSSIVTQAAQAFPDPTGGWTYVYNGDQLQVGEPAFDGTWTHDNGSDAFKGDEIGGVLDPVNTPANAPGGAILLMDGNVQYLRMQDPGDPRDYDGSLTVWDDPSNRKIYFGHYLWQDLPTNSTLAILDTGVTLTFRARVPTPSKAGGPLDPLHPDGRSIAGDYPSNGVVPYPEGGDGYVTSDGAKGNFVIRQFGDAGAGISGGAIALSLTVPSDTPGGNPDSGRANFSGLTMNERNGPATSGAVDFGEGSGENNFPLDPTDWHEFWIAIRKTRDPVKADATHDVFVWRDGTLVATSHKVTAGDGSDLPNGSFIATGGSATPQSWALDVDWFGYKEGFVLPEGGQVPPDVIVTPVGGTLFYDAAGELAVDVEALMPGSTLSRSGFTVVLNGVDITDSMTFTGNDGEAFRTASYSGLQPSTQYTAVVTVTDSTGLTTEVISDFDTFIEAGGLTIESEDYNDSGGMFFEDPAPGDTFNFFGTVDVDYFDTTTDTAGTYRPLDTVDMDDGNDAPRAKFASFADWQITEVETGEWLNYTRTFPATVFTPYLRAGAGADRQLRLDRVTGDRTQPNQTVKPLGLFQAAQTRTVNTYRYMPLTDAFGVARRVNLSGETTVRLTATDVANDVNHNFLYFADAGGAASTLPWASAVSPAPAAVDVPADALVTVSLMDGQNAVTVAGIQMKFDGQDVTASLVKADTALGADASYNPGGMSAGSNHAIELTYADSTGASETRTWSFTVAGTSTAEITSIGLNFGASQAGGALTAADVAGVPTVAQANWNNLNGQSGTNNTVIGDASGSAQTTEVIVDWNSNNLWSSTGAGEENNGLTGVDRTLMTGYLDTEADTTTTVTISGIPDSLVQGEFGYDVYVYALGGVAGRGGAYRVVDPASGSVISDYVKSQSPASPVAYVEVPTTDPNAWGAGTHVRFRGLTASNIRIEATTVDPWGFGSPNRAPINAVQLVLATEAAPPKPAKFDSIVRNPDGSITVTWTGAGVLEAAESLSGPWDEIEGATSPFTFEPESAALFGRVRTDPN
ncbi:MAG: hypothetical protein KJ072_09150 [Verrucomicrobia bacterium]|nr:hypothetical protein [Verrucomicrobiota bacterium]